MKKIAITLAATAGVVALSAGPASAASPSNAANAVGQATSDALYQMEQMQQYQMDAGSKAAALESQASEYNMAQAAAKAMKDATNGYAQ
jgi:ABC-type transporter MlaC component